MPTATQLRRGVASLATLASRDLSGLWRQVSTPDQAREALRDVLPVLVETYGSAAATLAADWYDDLRDEAGVRGRFTAIPADLSRLGTDELAGWGVGPLFQAEPDWSSAATLIEGGLQRRIANASRETVTVSAVKDSGADGWQRIGGGECDFCTLLINRGAVYTEATADFASHDHCNCAATPAFGGEPRPVTPYQSPLTESSSNGGGAAPPVAETKTDEPLSPMERMARALSPAELRMETKRGSANARAMAHRELTRRGLK